MRNAHSMWRRWVQTPSWRSADAALKSVLNKEKDRLCTAAALERKNLLIGRRLLDLQKGLTEMAELAYQGYTNHVLAVVAPLEDCERRGRRRESSKGKRYESREFEQSIASIAPMIAACNGTYKVVRPVELEGEG